MGPKSPKSWWRIFRVVAEYVVTIEIALLAGYLILGGRW